ncbi:MAG: hypothetical protein ACYCQJ_15515 [Nitrososphaerales archaeon]
MFESERGDTMMLIILYGDVSRVHEEILNLQLENTTQISKVNMTKRKSQGVNVNLPRETIGIIARRKKGNKTVLFGEEFYVYICPSSREEGLDASEKLFHQLTIQRSQDVNNHLQSSIVKNQV